MDAGMPTDALKFFTAAFGETRDEVFLLMAEDVNGKIIRIAP